jgi:hypothetical protein
MSYLFVDAGQRKNAGGKNEGNLHYVVENKCRKMPDIGLSIILLKIS